jgi:hypothetical protein
MVWPRQELFAMQQSQYKVGQWVEIRTKQEILATLDQDGCLEGMPFMPEMFAFCGQRFKVHKSAHKTCDTVNPIRSRRLNQTVHLQTRCNGSAHGGCQAQCLLFWKDAWLKPVGRDVPPPPTSPDAPTEEDIAKAVVARGEQENPDPTYVCQATRLPEASGHLSPYDFRQYLTDLTSGNVTFGRWISGLIYITYNSVINLGIGVGEPMRRLYDAFQRLRGGLPYPRHTGKLPMDGPTPTGSLDLKEGEWVRVKSFEEILATCNEDNKNRGMGFDAEQVPYCGGTYRVRTRVTQIINERTGKMMKMKNPCIILEDVYCQGRYSECRMFCAREIFSYWREIWLERTTAPTEPRKTASVPVSVEANAKA